MATAFNGSCEIYYESFGDPTDPTLLLVNGLGSQCINYHEDWCEMFAGRGLHVVRYDNRDVGLSSKFDTAPVGDHGEAYTISDMAADGIAVLDAIGVERAHVMGLSMGGMIVQVDGDRAPGSAAVDDVGDVTHRRARLRRLDAGGIRAC